MLRYGRALSDDGQWRIAGLVLEGVAADAEVEGIIALAAQARLAAGFVARISADWDRAEAMYQRARSLAHDAGDPATGLRAEIGQANVLWTRGNLPKADDLLLSVVRRARKRAPEVVARAMLMQAAVAHARGNYKAAVVIAGQALACAQDDVRYQVLVDLANFLGDYGLKVAARDALVIIARDAAEFSVRAQALQNLLALAVETADQDRFVAIRRDIDATRLSPRQQTTVALYSAQGWHRFGDEAAARTEIDRAAALAKEHGLWQLTFEVDAERERWKATTKTVGFPVVYADAQITSRPLQRVVTYLHSLAAS